ncbi:MAG: cytochrome c3 family protein [Planctomycetota bacterium]|jgi:predicted CXXCH cytochrome family protein
MNVRFGSIVEAVVILVWFVGPAWGRIQGSPHDLSALRGGDTCRYCHTPHGAMPRTPGWSRRLSNAVYKIYESSSLEAKVGQPTGPSKLCLSCHDGTVAMARTGGGKGGVYIIPGGANLGTDLSDDHPISFVYSEELSAKDAQIRSPSMLPPSLRLDRSKELQCTTCHNAHDNPYGHFLVMSNERSVMCVSCHNLYGWTNSVHEKSSASVGESGDDYLTGSGYGTVADNGCGSCHRPHSAGGHERLLHFDKSEDNCLNCHDGSVASTNLKPALAKTSRHGVRKYNRVHDLKESALSAPRHVECVDCHNPHAVVKADAQAPTAPGVIRGVPGVTAQGSVTERVQYEYEVCFKCHGDNPSRIESSITRTITQTNTRLEFDTSNPSYHPVVSTGVSRNVPSLKPPLTVARLIYCTDCHNSDGSSAPRGPHGSQYSYLLAYRYETADFTQESESSYELCYKCHSRNSILGDESFPKHRLHLEAEVPCSACHDPHGISSAQGTTTNNTHLINFDIAIVSRDPVTSRLEFEDQGVVEGRCFLECHGKAHSPLSY